MCERHVHKCNGFVEGEGDGMGGVSRVERSIRAGRGKEVDEGELERSKEGEEEG